MRTEHFRRAARDLLYLTLGLVTSVLAFAVWVTGVTVSVSLAVFIVGLPVVLVCVAVFRWTAELDRRNAALVLGGRLHGHYSDHRGERFLVRLLETLRDPQTWRDLAWLVLHSLVGFSFGVAAVSLVATLAGTATLPLWFWTIPGDLEWGPWSINSVGGALAVVPFAVPLAAATYWLLRGMALAEAKLAAALLGPWTPHARRPHRPLSERLRSRDLSGGLSMHVGLALVAGLTCALIWALTTRGYFWPAWVWLGLGVAVGNHAVGVRALRAEGDPRKTAFRAKAELSALVLAICVTVWALAGGGYFWPAWPALGVGLVIALRWLLVFEGHRLPWVRGRQLARRVDELTRTRRGALDVQAAELRRIERDLHDGAQARLVALTMQLGRAEERLGDQPEVAQLVRDARGEASAAIAELRDLARGIAPPVLADRGLAAAVDALARRVVMPVAVDVRLDRRPPPVIETAAYFVVAEALTNAAKHAPDASAEVRISMNGDVLIVDVADDGPGGAVPDGSGLTGLRHRVEALDGSLRVEGEPGRGTTIRAELPCG